MFLFLVTSPFCSCHIMEPSIYGYRKRDRCRNFAIFDLRFKTFKSAETFKANIARIDHQKETILISLVLRQTNTEGIDLSHV